jgi:hypothetical protein
MFNLIFSLLDLQVFYFLFVLILIQYIQNINNKDILFFNFFVNISITNVILVLVIYRLNI